MSALSGVRVFDFGRYVAGPWCGQLLQGLGADVVRVERPGGGEDRAVVPVGPEQVGAYLVHCGRGKRSMTLRPNVPAAGEIVDRIIGAADVIVANVPDETLAGIGLDWEHVQAVNPRCVLATATTFGTIGPYAGRLGFDGVGQVMSGSTHLAGHPGDPMKSFVPWVDYGTATLLALGVIAALHERTTTGVGRRVEASLLATALANTGHMLIEQAVEHTDRAGTGNRHPAIGPSDIVATRDGHLIVQVVGDAMFARWCALVGRDDLVGDPRFVDDPARGDNGVELSKIHAEWCAARTTAQAIDELAAAEIPAGPVLTLGGVLADPHIASVMLDQATVPGAGIVPVTGYPLRYGGAMPGFGDRPPAVGEHTDDVLGELGYDIEAIAVLRAGRAV